jgi:hypothetical protein
MLQRIFLSSLGTYQEMGNLDWREGLPTQSPEGGFLVNLLNVLSSAIPRSFVKGASKVTLAKLVEKLVHYELAMSLCFLQASLFFFFFSFFHFLTLSLVISEYISDSGAVCRASGIFQSILF